MAAIRAKDQFHQVHLVEKDFTSRIHVVRDVIHTVHARSVVKYVEDISAKRTTALSRRKSRSWKFAMITCKERSLADHTKQNKTVHASTCEARESTRKRFQETQNKHHEDHSAERSVQFYESLKSCAQTYSYAPGSGCEGRR